MAGWYNSTTEDFESLALSGTKCIPEKKLQMSASVSVTQYVRVLHFLSINLIIVLIAL